MAVEELEQEIVLVESEPEVVLESLELEVVLVTKAECPCRRCVERIFELEVMEVMEVNLAIVVVA